MQIHSGWVLWVHQRRPDSYQRWRSTGESEECWEQGGGSRAAHIFLSASRDEWLGDNGASAAGRKMIPATRCGSQPRRWRGLLPARGDPHLLAAPVGKWKSHQLHQRGFLFDLIVKYDLLSEGSHLEMMKILLLRFEPREEI